MVGVIDGDKVDGGKIGGGDVVECEFIILGDRVSTRDVVFLLTSGVLNDGYGSFD